MPLRFSFIVPFHSGLAFLARCLDAITPLAPDSELIIAADEPAEDCAALAVRHGARIVSVSGPSGPAVARNAAAAAATGDVLVFVDADVVASRVGVARMRRLFSERREIAAVFGAYDDLPADPGFMSQYKNLAHAFVHRTSAASARTFWAGFGAVRRIAFERVAGFDERFGRPSVEDIDLGYRLTAAGYSVVLDPRMSASHLKRWTIASAIACDVRDRGIPWTQLIWRYRAWNDDLNLRRTYRWSILLAYLFVGALLLTRYDGRSLVALGPIAATTTIINWRSYRFFYARRGLGFAARVWLLRVIQDLFNGVSFAAGTCLFFCARYLGIRMPGALPADCWTVAGRGGQFQQDRARRISVI